MMKIKKIEQLKGQITVKSGLHIGAGNDAVEIGGSDSPLIKDSITSAPYIPGSSLKGRMRWLLEKTRGENRGKYPSSDEENNLTAKVFGASVAQDVKSPTRIIFKDAKLSQEDFERFKNGEWDVELKMETAIDRISGKAIGGSLRNAERVPAGIKFDYEINLVILENDKESEIKEMIENGLKLVEITYLGGRGTRGYGSIEFNNKKNWNTILNTGE